MVERRVAVRPPGATFLRHALREYLDRASHGETVVVTREGRPIVQLLAANYRDTVTDPMEVQAALQRIRARAGSWGIKATPDEWKSWVDEGRS